MEAPSGSTVTLISAEGDAFVVRQHVYSGVPLCQH